MAHLASAYPWAWERQVGKTPEIDEAMRESEQEAFEKLWEKSIALPPGEIVGAVLKWPIADGYAYYLVIKEKPFTLQHIPYGDAWAADPALIRGLRKSDARQMLEAERYLRRVFDKTGRKVKAAEKDRGEVKNKKVRERIKKREPYVCQVCGANLYWREHQELVGDIYPKDGRMRDKGEVVFCVIDAECSVDARHLCGWKFNKERVLVPVK